METTTRRDEQSSDRIGLIHDLGDVAHGFRTAAHALAADHEIMAHYAARAAELVEGAGEKLKNSPRLVASLDQLTQRSPMASGPTAALLGFVGKRILSTLAGPAPRAKKPDLGSQRGYDDDANAPSIAEQLSGADELVIEMASDEPPQIFEPWSHAAEDRVATEETPSFDDADFPPARDDERASGSTPRDGYASRYG